MFSHTISPLPLLSYLVIIVTLLFTHSQHDEGKLEELLREVTSTEPPADAPAPPPDQDEPEENTELLPSQRDGGNGIALVVVGHCTPC